MIAVAIVALVLAAVALVVACVAVVLAVRVAEAVTPPRAATSSTP